MLENLAANWPWLVAMGLAAGLLSGLFGIGGGIVMVPMLVLLTTATPKEAQGLSLGFIIFTALAAFVSYKYKFDVRMDYRAIALLGVGGIVGAVLGSYVMHHMPTIWLSRLFACLMIVAAVKLLVQPPVDKATTKPDTTASASQTESTTGDAR